MKNLELMTYDCQKGMYYSDIKKLENGFVVYSNIVESESWNFFTGFHAETIDEFENAFKNAKGFFHQIKRNPCFVISPSTIVSDEVREYMKQKYTNFSTSAVMLTDNFDVKKKCDKAYSFRQIDNAQEKELFVQTFKTSKSQTLSSDTYKALPNYFFEALEKSFESQTDWKFCHFVSECDGESVGMVSACVKGEWCGLYGGGTYVAHRKKGVFSNLLKFVETELKKQGVKNFFGITEKGSYNEKLYNSIGWVSVFDMIYYK